jgi:hypothetical protein
MKKLNKIKIGSTEIIEELTNDKHDTVFSYQEKGQCGDKIFIEYFKPNLDKIDWVEFRVRNVKNNDESKIQISIETRKGNRSYYTSFSIPKEFEKDFIKAVSEEWK